MAVRTVRDECAAHDGIDLVRFVLFGDRSLAAFEAALADRPLTRVGAPDHGVRGAESAVRGWLRTGRSR